MSSSSTTVTSVVPMFDGTNYMEWVSRMRGFLRSQGLWRHVNGDEPSPAVPGNNATADQLKAYRDWLSKDDMANGHLSIRISQSLQTHVKSTSRLTWNAIEAVYGTPGAAAIFSVIKRTMSFHITGNQHPRGEIAELSSLFDQMALHGNSLPEVMKAAALLLAIPPKWDHIASTIVAAKTISELRFEDVATFLVNEWERAHMPGETKKVSAVKGKGKDPKWKARGKRSGKKQKQKEQNQSGSGKGKGKGRGNQGQSNDHSGHGHGFSISAPVVHTKSDLLRAALADPKSKVYHRVNGPSAHRYTGETPGVPSVFPEVNKTLSLAERMGVVKTPQTLRRLDPIANASSSKRTLDDYTDSLPAAKRANYSSEEDEISLGEEELSDADFCEDSDDDFDIADTTQLESERYDSSQTYKRISNDALQRPLLMASYVDAHHVDLGSLDIFNKHAASCPEYKKNRKGKSKGHRLSSWIVDSGASSHVTGDLEDFLEYKTGNFGQTRTASGIETLTAKGTVLLEHDIVYANGDVKRVKTKLYPVLYFPALGDAKLLSMGQFMNQGQYVRGSTEHISFYTQKGDHLRMTSHPYVIGDTIFWVNGRCVTHDDTAETKVASKADYDTWHKRYGHPSKEALRRAKEHTTGIPKDLQIPKESPICRGCAEGKMPEKSFPPSTTRAKEPFDLVHSDLKDFSTLR